MAKKRKTARQKGASYLTKRILVSAAKSSIREAAKNTMDVMGYSIIAEDGWVVKKYPNGDTERIEQISTPVNNVFNLD